MNIHSSRSVIFLKDDSIHMNITHFYIISWYITIKESKIEKLNHGYLLLFLENTIPIFKKKIRPFLSVLFFFKNNNYHQIWQKIMFFKSIVLYMLCKAIKSREPINNTTKSMSYVATSDACNSNDALVFGDVTNSRHRRKSKIGNMLYNFF